MTNIIPQKQRYLPHTLDTKYHAVNFYRKGNSVNFVCRKYKISKRSLMRWNKKFDSLEDLRIAMEHYIEYYNTKRISLKLKGHTPVEFRNMSNTNI